MERIDSSSPIWPCSRRGLPHTNITTRMRSLLHYDFTLTRLRGRFVSAALSVGSLRPGVTGRRDSVELGLSSHQSNARLLLLLSQVFYI